MLKRRRRTLLRIVGFVVIMTVAPLAFGTTSHPVIQLNDACASGTCSPEYGSICDKMAHYYLKDLT